jgi:hypothetical protein
MLTQMIPIGTKLDQITQEQLRHRLHYSPETGVFTWKVTQFECHVGKVAGYPNYHPGTGRTYIKIKLHKKLYLAHRLVWLYITGTFPKNDIDHINQDGTDNRLVNLRNVTDIENTRNKKCHSNNTSGVMGVHFHKSHNKWRARISTTEKRIHLGNFNTKEEAIAARLAAEIELGYHENHGKERG